MESRRSFLRLLAGATAAALTPAVPFIPPLARPVERLRRYATFSELITQTLREHSATLAQNVAQNNALLEHLKKQRST
jgi:hypothetical protein